jgi:CHAT domain-containing protein
VQDGILRSVPMAALHDGNQFLIERYAIATTASLTLTNPRPLQRKGLRALALGLTQSVEIEGQKFGALANVDAETQTIERILPGSRRLLDLDFTSKTLTTELDRSNYPIIHIATHGQFGNEPNDTFLVTGDKKKLTINILDDILRSVNVESPIELLSLTACTTAVGDDRAALGLAGVAAQAGAKSVLASLWLIEDNTTAKLVDSFYSSLREETSKLSKAEALQKAQLSILKERPHPAYWAAFTLIGNWQ